MVQLKSQRTSRCEVFRDHINQVLRNQEADTDDAWWEDEEAWEELGRLAWGDQDYVTNSKSLKIEGGEKLILAVYKKDRKKLFDAIAKQAGLMAKDPETEKIHVIFFAQDMRDRIQLERSFSITAQAQVNAVAKAGKSGKNPSIQYTYVLDQKYKKGDVRLTGLKRYEIMQMPPVFGRMNIEPAGQERESDLKEGDLHGLVFSVDLIQLVEIYNMIGDQLFRENVRFGINEMMGVDQAICKTLEEEPEYFWYKNNGITILAKNRDLKLKSLETLLLDRPEPGKELLFSVINGAQTITASAKYFFDMEYRLAECEDAAEKARLEETLKNSKKAQVLVRVIYVPGEETEASGSLAKEISVALNRQKPVKIEDIAFTTPFMIKLVSYLEQAVKAGETDFCLVRRGEGTFKKRQMEMIPFARARKACVGEPGEARSKGANELLKFQIDGSGVCHFVQKDIFVDAWTDADEIREGQVFRRFYGGVWFADQLAERYETVKKQLKTEVPEVLTVVRNGKWYITAALVSMLNGFSSDFSDFHSTLEDVEEQLLKGILCFSKIIVQYVGLHKGEYGEINSNLFKKSDWYQALMKRMEEIYREKGVGRGEPALDKLLSEFISLFISNAAKELVSEADAFPFKLEECSQQNYVVLGGERVEVKNITEAMERTAQYILTYYEKRWDRLEESSMKWLTQDEKQASTKDGYFRGLPKELVIKGKRFWVGTSSNTDRKMKQIRELCGLLDVEKGEIAWYQKGEGGPVFWW